MIRSVLFRVLLATQMILFCTSVGLRAEETLPSAANVQKGILTLWARLNKGKPAPAFKVREVLDCYPIAKDKGQNRICLVDMDSPDGSFHIQEVPLTLRQGGLDVLEPTLSISPACPGGNEAKHLLRTSLNAPQLEVLSEPEEGVFTEERGKFREKSGPKILMCSYEIKRSDEGEQTLVGYFSHKGGSYQMEPGYELWDD